MSIQVKEKSLIKVPISSLQPGEKGIIASVETSQEIRWKLLEMGIGPGEEIQLIRKTPFGGPIEFELMHYRLAIRKSEADKVFLTCKQQ